MDSHSDLTKNLDRLEKVLQQRRELLSDLARCLENVRTSMHGVVPSNAPQLHGIVATLEILARIEGVGGAAGPPSETAIVVQEPDHAEFSVDVDETFVGLHALLKKEGKHGTAEVVRLLHEKVKADRALLDEALVLMRRMDGPTRPGMLMKMWADLHAFLQKAGVA